MTADNEKTISGGVNRTVILYPWLIALAALALYGLTLNGWVTFGSLPFASQITGWDWHPGPLPWRPAMQYPLFLVLSFPLRCLPVGWRAIGLNGFTAVCAAVTLAILARSIRILSHDRTQEQRQRVSGEHALLSGRGAFLPSTFAVLLLGAQLTFWENAVLGTGEMIDLLVFAFLILCLLEFRISKKQGWLSVFAFVYGVGMANNWALIGFVPCFLVALIWIKGIKFFELGFALRMARWGALGLLLYGLIPLLGVVAHDGSFWELLHEKLREQKFFLMRTPRYFAAIAGVQTLVPLLFAAIRWDDLNLAANDPTRVMFRVVHLVFLSVGVSMFFDMKLSASPRNMGLGVTPGMPCFLTFYYLAALCVGYFSGYVLLVSWRNVIPSWRDVNPSRGWGWVARISRVVNLGVVGLLWAAAFCLPVRLFCTNFPHIRDFNSAVVAQFGRELVKSLPAKPAVVLADDPLRLYLALGASQNLGLADQYIFVESRSLVHRKYLRYLADRYPSFGKELGDRDHIPERLTDRQAGGFLARLVQRQPVYYLHPSFGGGHLDQVCMTPYRLGGFLHPRPTNMLETLDLSPTALAANQAYWHSLEKEPLISLSKLAKRSADARRIAGYYSHILDYWGTELQKTGTRRKIPDLLEDANAQFAVALRLNSNNVVARANRQYNARLRGEPPTGALVATSDVAVQFYNHWDLALAADGPADVPDLDIQIGRYLAQRGAYRQAAISFQRCLELAPNNTVAELDLANAYVDLGLVDAAFALIKDMRKRSAGNPLELAGVEALAYITRNDFAQADKLLADTHNKNPNDVGFAGVMADLYRYMGYRVLREGERNAAHGKTVEKDAAVWFKKALKALDESLRMLTAATANSQEIDLVNLRIVELQKMIENY